MSSAIKLVDMIIKLLAFLMCLVVLAALIYTAVKLSKDTSLADSS